MRLILALLVSLCVVLPVQAGKVYRWVDKNGTVHYGDQPTPNAKEIQLKDANSGVAPAPAPPVADRAAACTAAREKLDSYLQADRIVEKNALGQETEYSDEQRAQLIEQMQLETQRACASQDGG